MPKENIRSLNQQHDGDGSVSSKVALTSADDKTRCSMTVPPSTVVPVIFVPGIMGSNLRDKAGKKSVWNVNSELSLAWQWAFRSAKSRQKKLSPGKTEVDPTGDWYGKSATVPDEKTAIARGQGSTSKAFYGEFVRWLDDMLNSGTAGPYGFFNTLASYGEDAASWLGSLFSGNGDDEDDACHTPWDAFVGKDFSEEWGAERSFEKLSADDARQVWGDFYCPVHVVGYNWLQSNKDSGEYLAEQIEEVIGCWNGRAEGKNKDGPRFSCEKVILVSHSMGGLTCRAALLDWSRSKEGSPVFGKANERVLGIVHGEQPANGAAAAYHHCRSGYGGLSSWVLGHNAAQVTAVFANAPGAMELLPNHLYPAEWLKARVSNSSEPLIKLPESDPYIEIYLQKKPWWRLMDESLIDPSGESDDAWFGYGDKIANVSDFHHVIGSIYHSQTYIHYGEDSKDYSAYGDLVWHSDTAIGIDSMMLLTAPPVTGSNPVKVDKVGSSDITFSIMDPSNVGYPQPGDGTVPTCSGEAPVKLGEGNVKQAFSLIGFDHQDAYKGKAVRHATLYSVGMLLQQAKA